MTDIIVVGAGPAGLTAAVYACRAGKSVLVIEKGGFGGQITFSPKVENYPSQQEISGMELAEMLTDHAIAMGAELTVGTVEKIEKTENGFSVVCDDDTYEAKAVIIATGARHRLLGLDREEDLVGNGISFCAVCDGSFFAGQDVAMVGGGNSALQEAILLSEVCKSVTVIQNLADFTGERKLADILMKRDNVKVHFNTLVTGLLGADELTGITVRNTETEEESTLTVNGLFIAVGLVPETEPFADVLPLNQWGYADIGEDCKSTTEGIFVAGDCRSKTVRQLTTACADGSVAALAACHYIDEL